MIPAIAITARSMRMMIVVAGRIVHRSYRWGAVTNTCIHVEAPEKGASTT